MRCFGLYSKYTSSSTQVSQGPVVIILSAQPPRPDQQHRVVDSQLSTGMRPEMRWPTT